MGPDEGRPVSTGPEPAPPSVDRPDPAPFPADRPTGLAALKAWVLLEGSTDQPLLFAEPTSPPVGEERVGICCSGGGLRSASFAFGGMQVLWNERVLQRARYLAGVSGGSYAVTAATILRLRSKAAFADPAAPAPYALGSPELDYLRNRTDYLAPGPSGRWNLALRFVIGVGVNVFVVFTTIYLLGLGAGWLYGLALPGLEDPGDEVSFGWLAYAIVAVPFVLGVLAQLVDLLFRPAAEKRWRRLVRWSGSLVALALVAAVFVFVVPAVLVALRRVSIDWATPGTGTGTGGRSASVTGALLVILGSALNVASKSGMSGITAAAGKVRAWPRKLLKIVSNVLLWVVGPLTLAVTFLVGVDLTTDGWSSQELLAVVALGAVIGLLGWQGNPIAWSAQPFYKRRLRTVFSLERVIEDHDGQTRVRVRAIPQEDEPRLSQLADAEVTDWPELLICAAANVSDLGLTPPKFGVSGFVFSQRELGGHLVGYVPTAMYEEAIKHRRGFQKVLNSGTSAAATAGQIRDVSPLSAVSISGAAISPSMGRMTRPAARMMLTLLNLRLGVWLPNPHHVSEGTWDRTQRVKPRFLVKEMLGTNSLTSRFLYVTDGGHYENLGLVELLRRGCTEIWCLDAAGDHSGQLSTLGQAQAIARAELGVEFDPIDIDAFAPIDDEHPNLSKNNHAIVPFRYANKREGRLVYVREALVPTAPTDLITYQRTRPGFPYDGTGDQFYDVAQFEAYRRLGVDAVTQAHASYRAAAVKR